MFDLIPSKVTYYGPIENTSETIVFIDEDNSIISIRIHILKVLMQIMHWTWMMCICYYTGNINSASQIGHDMSFHFFQRLTSILESETKTQEYKQIMGGFSNTVWHGGCSNYIMCCIGDTIWKAVGKQINLQG